jgi:hypothetical protein
MRWNSAIIILAGAGVMGCHPQPQMKAHEAPATQPSYVGDVRQVPLAAPAQSLPVQEGAPPLAYRVESSGTVRVVDETSGATIASSPLNAGEFVAVTQGSGVVLGGEKLVKGPLPDGHRYGIYVDHSTGNLYRSGAIVPAGSVGQ